MTDTYLNLPDAATFEAMKGTTPFEYTESGFTQSEGWNVDVIGDNQFKVTSWNAEGEPTFTPIPGFLINLRSDIQLPEALKQYEIYPETPIRVWA